MEDNLIRKKISELPELQGSLKGFCTVGVKDNEQTHEPESHKVDLGFVEDAAALANQKAGLANDAAALANQKAVLAEEKAALANQKAGLANDAAALANQKAALVQDKLDVANQDHTRAGSDHETAANDHTIAGNDHQTAGTDHTRAVSDHDTALSDHTRAGSDHETAGSDHEKAGSDHTRAGSDHETAGTDHTRAGSDHDTAVSDHSVAGVDHTRAGSDHDTADGDHTRAALDHATWQNKYDLPVTGIPKSDLSSGVQASLDKADASAPKTDVDAIKAKIPEQASSSNQLADKEFVNSSIATATATHRGTYNLVSDLGLTISATQQQIATAIATKLAALSITPDNNDYVFVQIPTADATPTQIARVDRYKYNGAAWSFEFSLNNSGFTSAQWAAINSGITSALVTAFNAKYDKPSGGIPKTDLNADIQTSLGKADTAIQDKSDKADRDIHAVAGNLAKFNADGHPVDSGIPATEIPDQEKRIHALETFSFGRDLSRIDPVTGRTLQSRTTANSYIIRTAGEYRLPLIYGNAVKDGETNAAAYTRQGSTYTADFVNYKGNPITKPNIEEDTGEVAASAGLLWQTASGMISTVALFEYTDGNYLAFTVANVPSTNGLAVLYIKDANGDIMWSFTIWVVSEAEDLSDIEIVNHTNVTYKLMGLPFGAIWNANHDHYVVPHFQWGRKDAMCPAAAYNSTSNMTLYDIEGNVYTGFGSYGVADDADAGGTVRSVANSIKMPNKFFMEYDATNYHWNNLTNFNNFWNAAETTNSSLADNQDTAIKTVYDPCPIGWTLPAGRFATGFTTTGDNSSTASQFNVIGSWANGWNFKKNDEDTDGVFFPAAGIRYRTSGALSNVGGYGYWWTFAPISQTHARRLYFGSGGVGPLDGNYRAYGFGVWPVRE